ncbi:MAG: hypothetical protein WDZ35_05200 [Crocinitomicaceae bacterium]
MTIKEKLKNPLIQQYLLEIALPVVGYFFFGWSMAIIAAFYFIDFFASEIARNRRVYKVYKTNSSNHPSSYFVLSIFAGLALFTVNLLWVWTSIQDIFPEKEQLVNELTTFAKEELWLLLPVVYLVYHFKDLLTFYMPRRFVKTDYKKMVIYQMVELFILTFLIFIGMFLWYYFKMDDISVLISFIVLKIGFDILLLQTLTKKYKGD